MRPKRTVRPAVHLVFVPIIALWCALASAAERLHYSHCARAADPPTCLIRTATEYGAVDADNLLEAVIMSGSVDLVEPNMKALLEGAKSKVGSSGLFLRSLGVDLEADPAEAEVKLASDGKLLAAIALAAAAHWRDDPFEDQIVQSALAGGATRSQVAQLAVTLWNEVDTYYEWAAEVTRPRGLSRIWAAIVADPPEDPKSLASLATSAAFGGRAQGEGLALLRILEARPDATASTKADAASALARFYSLADEAQRLLDSGGATAPDYDVEGIRVDIAEARLRGGYDERAAKSVVAHAMSALENGAFHSYLRAEPRVALEAAAARAELRSLGDAYRRRGSEGDDTAEDRGQWFAVASDCYRRAGEHDLALAAARQGLPFVGPAVAARNPPLSRTSSRGAGTGSRQQAVQANGFGSEAVLALYRAGSTAEALHFGYLTGFDRYRNATLAGEEPNAQWVVDDHSWFYVAIVAREIIGRESSSDLPSALNQLTHALSTTKRFTSVDEFEAVMAVLAARSGDSAAMTLHLTRAAASEDKDSTADDRRTNAFFALHVAAEWRRAQTILARSTTRIQ